MQHLWVETVTSILTNDESQDCKTLSHKNSQVNTVRILKIIRLSKLSFSNALLCSIATRRRCKKCLLVFVVLCYGKLNLYMHRIDATCSFPECFSL